MKLLLITAIKEFEKNVKELLLHSGVKAFSYTPLKGFKDMSNNEVKENWFASSMQESESVMFMVFSAEENVALLFDKIGKFNDKQEFASKIHIASLSLEKTI